MSCFLLLLVMGLLVTLVLGDGCPYQECYCSGPYIYCDDRSLKEIPQILFKDRQFTSNLDMDKNEITTVPAGSLPANLSVISLLNNPLETVDDAAFDESIYTLLEVSFSQARFTQIPEAVLRLKVLQSLTVSETNIIFWNEDAMKQLNVSMKTLILDTVGLTTWPNWIKSMTNLTRLTISGSSISLIPNDALDMVNLVTLDLSNNSLVTLPRLLSNITSLSRLALDYNRITDVTWLPQLSHLVTLSLNNNKITDAQKLSNALKPYADTLSSFDIHDNSLTSNPELSFMSMITSLDLTFNRISDANFSFVPSQLSELKVNNNFLPSIPRIRNNFSFLNQVYLNSNKIRIIQGTDFPPEISVVDLGSNLITQLTGSSFPDNSRIYTLTLSNNPIATIYPETFINLPWLAELYLQQTKLTRLPLGLASLIYLSVLDVSGSTDLLCTCLEQSLQSRIQSMESTFVRGNCGETSVDFFFRNLSPLCPPLL